MPTSGSAGLNLIGLAVLDGAFHEGIHVKVKGSKHTECLLVLDQLAHIGTSLKCPVTKHPQKFISSINTYTVKF